MTRIAMLLGPVAVLALSLGVSVAQAADPAARPGAAHFKQMDTNGDGSLSRDEVASAPQLSKKFDEIDTDHNGMLSPAELKGFSAAHKGDMFAKMDTNGDGQLSKDEVAGKQRLAAKFDQIDTNKDGMISQQEMSAVAAMKQR